MWKRLVQDSRLVMVYNKVIYRWYTGKPKCSRNIWCILVKIKITTPRKVETPCGVFFCLVGDFGGIFGAFSRKSPIKK